MRKELRGYNAFFKISEIISYSVLKSYNSDLDAYAAHSEGAFPGSPGQMEQEMCGELCTETVQSHQVFCWVVCVCSELCSRASGHRAV